jgi:hypothetical protein
MLPEDPAHLQKILVKTAQGHYSIAKLHTKKRLRRPPQKATQPNKLLDRG